MQGDHGGQKKGERKKVNADWYKTMLCASSRHLNQAHLCASIRKLRCSFLLAPSSSLHSTAPSWSIDNYAQKTARNNARDGKSDDPAHVDPSDHSPVDAPPCSAGESHSDCGTSDTLGCRDW